MNAYAKRAKGSIVFNLMTKRLTYYRKPQAVKQPLEQEQGHRVCQVQIQCILCDSCVQLLVLQDLAWN